MEPISSEAIDLDRTGGKAHGLRRLSQMGYRVPDFVVVAHDQVIDDVPIDDLLQSVQYSAGQLWAVRSSANVEDGRRASFAGQFQSVIGIPTAGVKSAVDRVRSSLRTESVKEYCQAVGVDQSSLKMNVVIQRFDEPSVAGVWMSGKGESLLEWVHGRGEALVGGHVRPFAELYDHSGKLIRKEAEDALIDERGVNVSDICREIERRLGYSADLEFCITRTGLVWLQLRHITGLTHSAQSAEKPTHEVRFLTGEPASPHRAQGVAHRHDLRGKAGWLPGCILVATATTPAEMLFVISSEAVVTKMGGRLSHAAVVCRELGKACVVGVDISEISDGGFLLVDGVSGRVEIPKLAGE